MQTRRLGRSGPEVSAIGLGCMGMSGMYGPADRAEAIATIHAALDAGITLIDTGDFYGMGHNELLIGEALRGVPRDAYLLSVKFGAQRDPAAPGSATTRGPQAVKNFLAYTLQRLGTDYIDIYRPARLDPSVPIEDTVGAIAECVKAGWVRHIGLSRSRRRDHPPRARGAPDLRPADRICADHPRHRGAILPACRELGIGVTAYGVFSRGLLTGGWQPGARRAGDFRAHAPRFQGEAGERNLGLPRGWPRWPTGSGSARASWRSPGCWRRATTSSRWSARGGRERVTEAVAALETELDADQLAAIEAAIPADAMQGERYARRKWPCWIRSASCGDLLRRPPVEVLVRGMRVVAGLVHGAVDVLGRAVDRVELERRRCRSP